MPDDCPECKRLWAAYARARHEFQTLRDAAFHTAALPAAAAEEARAAEARREETRAELLRHMTRARHSAAAV